MAFPFERILAAGRSSKWSERLRSTQRHKTAVDAHEAPLLARRKMLVEPLEPRLLLSADLGVLDNGGLNDYFDQVQTQLDNAVFSAPIPLIGTQLAERQSGRIADKISIALQSFTIVPTGASATANDVKTGLSNALGSMIQGGQILDTTNADNSEYRFSLTLAGSESERIDLDLALGADPLINPQLGIEDEVLLSFDWTFDLTFGVFEDNVTADSFFFVDTSFGDELNLDNVMAVLDGGVDGQFDAKGTAGIFGALFQEDVGKPAVEEQIVLGEVITEGEDAVAARGSQFTGRYDIDIVGVGSKTLRNDIADLTVDAVVNGEVDINLDVDGAMIPDFADVSASDRVFNFAVEADLNISQSFVNANTQDALFGGDIEVDYEEVGLDLGTFFTEFVDPFVDGLQIGLSPIKPIVDFLSFPIPVLSEVGAAVGLGKITPIDLGILATAVNPKLTGEQKETALKNLTLAKGTVEFLNVLFDLQPIAEGLPDTAGLLGFAVQLTPSAGQNTGSENENPEPPPPKERKLVRQNASTDLLKDVQNATEKSSAFFSTVAGRIDFPFLHQPDLVRDMLLGDTTPVLANFGLDFAIGYVFEVSIPIIFPVLNAEFQFELKAALDFDAGFDLFGANALTQSLDFSSDTALQQSVDDNIHRLSDGFFFDDHIGEDAPDDLQDGVYDPTEASKGDAPEITLSAKLSAGAKVGPDLLVAQFNAGVRVFFNTSVFFDLNDLPDAQNAAQADYINDVGEGNATEVPSGSFTYDGRVRLGELDLVLNADPFGLFNTSGALYAGLEAFVFASVGFSPFEIIIVDKTFLLASALIYDFNIFQLDDQSVLDGVILNPPTIGAVDSNGTLTLFAGTTADERVNTGPGRQGSDTEINEGFSVSSNGLTDADDPSGGETLVVRFYVLEDGERVERAQQTFDGVKRIVAAGGDGNDSFVVNEDVLADVDFSGGTGHDVLSYAGSGIALLRGNEGNDQLVGGSNDDRLEGGSGDDDLSGRGGDDTLLGGANNDRLDGGLGDDTATGGIGSDTYSWAPGQGIDTIIEDDGLPADTDRITVGGSFSITDGSYAAGSVGSLEAGDNIALSAIDEGGARKVLLTTSDGVAALESIVIDNIENISIAAGGGSDVVTVGDLTGTDVELLAIDLSAADDVGNSTDVDRVIFSGSSVADTLTVEGVFAEFDQTDLGADPEGGVGTTISREIVQLRDTTPGRDSRAFVINSSPDKDVLEVLGLGGGDTLQVSAGSANIDVSELIAVTLRGGDGDDTLITAYDDVTLVGGEDTDTVVVQSDGKVVDGETTLQLFATDLLISRAETDAGQVDERISFSEVEHFRLELEPSTAGNDLRVVSTIAGSVEIVGSTSDDKIALETLAGATTVQLNDGDNTVTVGKDGSVAGIVGDLQVNGGAGDDHVIFDSSAEVSDTLAEIGVVALAGLVAPGALRYNDDVETVELRLGLGADEVQVPDLTRRVIVDLGGGEDRVDATLFGTPNGALNGPGLRAINVEQVNLSNDDNAGSSNWLATANQLRAGTAGVFDPLAPGFYDQVVLETFAADVVNVALGDGPGSDSLLVWDLKTETHVDLRAGDDSVTVGDSRPGAERALVDIEASFVVSGGVGTNTLTIDDAANTLSGIPGFIDAASISGFAMGVGASIDYMGFATLEITLADTEDDVTILDTSIATTLTTDATASGGDDTLTVVNASAGATINLGGASDHATVLGGSDLLIDGGNASGSDTIEFDIRGLTTPTAGAVLGENANGALLTDLGPIGDVAFDDFETARFELGQNSDTITIDHTIAGLTVEVDGAGGDDTVTIRQIGAATQINGESGRDTVVVEVLGAPEDLTDGQQLENLITDLGVDVETLTVDNRTNTVGVDWAIRSGVFSGNGTDLLFTDGADEIFIRAGSSGDSLDFEELAQPVDATIDGPRVVLELGDVVLESAGFGTFANFSNVVDFDDLDTGGFNNVTEYVEDGFRLTSSDSLGDPAVILRNDALSAAAEASDPANVFTLTEENNGGFALYSISLASLDAGTHTITFTGTTLNGETVTRTFDDVEGGSGFVTFDLPDTFTSLKSVSWTAGDPATGGNVLVDNIVAASLVPIGNATAVPGEIPLYRIAADTTFYTFEGFERLRSGSIFVDYDRDNAFDAGVDFNVTPGTSIAQAASYGVIGLTTDNSITQFRFAGDLMIGDGVTVTANGPNALSLLAGNNAFIEDNVTFNVSANGTTGGAGGGGSAGVPGGGGVGAGEGIGGNLQSEVGQGGEGGGAFEEGEEGQSGSRGADGESGRAGIAGQGGGVSGSGVNGGAAGVGGAGGAAGAGGTFGEGGAGGESGEPNHGAGGGGEVGDPGQAGGGGGDGRSGTAGQNNGSDGTLSGGGAGGSGGTGGGGGEGGGAGAGGSGGGAAGEDGFTVFSGNAGSSGASGGEGGNGGDGGAGGSGGAGGGGGGAIEIAAQGRVVMGTNVELLARGGNGQAGSSGASGLAGNSGSEAGGYAEGGESQTSGGDGKSGETGQGGTGGDGGRGGTGGAGGFGGSGAGGAGGTVKLSGTVIDADAAGVRVDTSGGTSLGQTVKIVGDGLNATYYSGAGNFSSGVITTRVESDVHAANGPGAFYPGGPTDNFSVKWTGQIEVTGTQLVKFHLGSDDGSQLLVDGNLVINGYVNQAFTTRSSAALSLAPGVHDITVFYYEAGGFAGIDLSYSRGFNFSGTFITTSVPQMLSADGETGRFIMESNVAGGAPASVDAQNWSTFAGPGDVNPFLSSTASTPLIADLAGGAEIYGLLDDTVTLDDIEAQIVGLVDPLESPDPDALAAVVRLDVGPGDYGVDYTNFDMLLFINLSDVVLDNPMLGVVGSPSNSYSTDLLIGGFATDTLFGGSGGPLDLDGLAPGQIWATLIPDTDPGGVSTSDRINASVAGNILSIDGDLLRDGEVRFITAPRPVVSDAGGLSGLQAVAVSPDGGEIYGISTVDQALIVANAGDLGQRQFFKDGIDGVDGLAGASAVVVSPDGLNVYVSGGDDRRIAIFDRDPASGDLTYVGTNGTAFDFDLYDTMAISADGGTLVVAGDQGGVTFDRAVDGSLSFFSGALGDNIDDVAVSDDGAKVYAVNAIVDTLTVSERGSFGSATVQQTIDLGALSVAGAGPIALAEASAVALSQDNAFVYVTGTDGVLAVFARDAATGDLTIKQVLVDGVNGIRGLEGANDVVGSADNAFVYVTGGSGRSLAVFERNATSGELQFAQALRGRTGLEAPAGLAAAADGNVYVAAETGLGLGNGGVASFSRAVFTGETVPLVVSHEAVEALSLTFGVGDDVIRQINAATVDVLDIDAGDGFNTADLLNVGAETTVSSGIGDDTITVRSDTDGAVMVSVDSGSGDDSVVVRELAAGNTLSINLGDDADEVQIAGEKLPATASISVNGGNGNDTLRFSAGGMPINPSAPVTPDGTIKVDDAAFGTVAYQSIEAVPGFDPSEAEVGGPYVVAEGGTLTLAGIATAATNTSIVSTRWDLNGDGVFGDASGEAPVLSWTELVALGIDDGDKSFEITIEVTDSAGNVTSDTGQLSVTNTDPQISSSGATSAIVGVPYVLNFSATDPGDDTISGWEVDWGDGSPRELFASDAISASHVYLTSGTFTPVVVATDEDGSGSFVGDPATTPYTAAGPTVTVVPPVPTITSVGTANELQISEGEGVTLRALVAGTPTTFTWDVDGDGVFGDETTIGLVSGTDLTLSAADLVALGRDDGNADYGVSVQVAFGDGTGGLGIDTSIGSADLTVLNAAPTAQLTNSTQVPGSPVNEGDSVTVSFVNQDDPSSADAAAGFTYSYDFDNDGVFEIVDSTQATVVAPGDLVNDAGTRTVRAVITDKDGGSFEAFTGVRVAEVAPTLSVIGADDATEGAAYALELSASDPGNDAISKWTVNWGDGTPDAVVNAETASLSHVFADDGVRIVTVTAQDEDGIYVTSKAVTVANVNPTIAIAGPASLDEGDGFVLTLEADDAGADTISTWQINWGDGTSDTVPGSATTASHIYADDSVAQPGGVFEIVATATDEDGGYVTTLNVRVDDVAPSTVLGGTGTPEALLAGPASTDPATIAVNEGSNFTLSIDAPTDPGDDTVTEYTIDWGDGVVQSVAAAEADASGFVPTLNVNHVYSDGAVQYTIAVTLIDDEGNSFANATTLDVDVRNVAPVLALAGNSSVNEGDVYTLTLGAPSDPGDDTVTAFDVDWGDGSAVERFTSAGEVTHIYRNAVGSEDKTISVSLVDEDGSYADVASKVVQVNEVPPALSIAGAGTSLEGAAYTLTLGDLVDPGSDSGVIAVTEYVVDWGDGNVESFTTAGDVEHTFADGLFNNQVSVDVVTAGGTFVDAAQLSVQVTNAAPTLGAVSIDVAPLPDLNNDNVVDFVDIAIVASSFFGDTSSSPLIAAADLNGDGVVDYDDINIVLGAYGQVVAPPADDDVGVGAFAAGGTAYIEGTFSDMGVNDTHEALIDWGDGTTTVASLTQGNGEGSFFGRHTYTEAGVFKVTVTVADSDADADAVQTIAYVSGVAVHDGVLHIVGTEGDDNISVTRNAADPTRIDVSANFVPGGTQTFDLAGISSAVVFAGDGMDNVTVADDVVLPFLISGGDGNDTLTAGGGSTVLLGGSGQDTLTGGAQADLLIGGDDTDELNGAGGNDLLAGGADNDAVNGGAGDGDIAFFNGNEVDYSVSGDATSTSVTTLDAQLDGDDTLLGVEDILFEDSTDSSSPLTTNPWADDLVTRLKGPAKDVDADDAVWLLFE